MIFISNKNTPLIFMLDYFHCYPLLYITRTFNNQRHDLRCVVTIFLYADIVLKYKKTRTWSRNM